MFVDEFVALAHFVKPSSVHSERLMLGDFEVQNFQLFSSQKLILDNKQVNEIEQKAQAKSTKKTTERGIKKFEKCCEKRKSTVGLKTVGPTDLRKILQKFFAKG